MNHWNLHVLEHMTPHAALGLIEEYLPYVRSGGRVIIVCPQEKGFSTDATHVHFFDTAALASTLTAAGLLVEKNFSFPFPRFMGKIFIYNEFVATGRKPATLG